MCSSHWSPLQLIEHNSSKRHDFLRIERFWVKKKFLNKVFWSQKFVSLGGGYLGAKNQNFKNCSKHDFFCELNDSESKKNRSKNVISQKITIFGFLGRFQRPRTGLRHNFSEKRKIRAGIFIWSPQKTSPGQIWTNPRPANLGQLCHKKTQFLGSGPFSEA